MYASEVRGNGERWDGSWLEEAEKEANTHTHGCKSVVGLKVIANTIQLRIYSRSWVTSVRCHRLKMKSIFSKNAALVSLWSIL